MATYGESRISSRPPPTNNAPGLFGRLLQRTRSKKDRKPFSIKDSKDTSALVPKSAAVPERSFQPTAPEALTATPPTGRRAAPAPTMGAFKVPHQQQPPMLKKKPSIRDRFRGLAKESTSPALTPTPAAEKKRVVYVPTHAAADFSRLAVSPRPASRQGHRFSYEDPGADFQEAPVTHTLVAPKSADDESQPLPGPRHYPQRGLETLDENGPVQIGRDQHVPEYEVPPQPASPTGDSRQQQPSHVGTSDIGGQSSNPPPTPAQVSEPTQPKQDEILQTQAEKDAQQQVTDYELFLQRAEERERSYREHLLRTLSQRQYPRPPQPPEQQQPEAAAAAAATSYQPPRQSGTYTADSAVVADYGAPAPARKGWEGRLSGTLDSGIGSKSSSHNKPGSGSGSRRGGQPPSDEQPVAVVSVPVTRVSNAWERGHRKRGSWTPSFGAGGGREAERGLERGGGGGGGDDVVPELDEGYTTLPPRDAGAMYGEGGGYATQQQQQPRTLKRQTSIKQRLGAYIKPARPVSRYEEPGELTRRGSKRVV